MKYLRGGLFFSRGYRNPTILTGGLFSMFLKIGIHQEYPTERILRTIIASNSTNFPGGFS